jgi:hypothetical protein
MKKIKNGENISILCLVKIVTDKREFLAPYYYHPAMDTLENLEENLTRYYEDEKIKSIEILSMAYSA